MCVPRDKGQHSTGSRLGFLEKSPSLGGGSIHVLGPCSLPSFHRGYYWYSSVIFKEQKRIFTNHKKRRGPGRSPVSQVLRVTHVQTGRLNLLFRHHVWQEEIKTEATIIIILTYGLLILSVSKMPLFVQALPSTTGPAQAAGCCARMLGAACSMEGFSREGAALSR